MVNCHEFGWHCFGWTLYSSDSVLQYTHSNPHLKEWRFREWLLPFSSYLAALAASSLTELSDILQQKDPVTAGNTHTKPREQLNLYAL